MLSSESYLRVMTYGMVRFNAIRHGSKIALLYCFYFHAIHFCLLKHTVAMGVIRENLLWAIGTGKTIDLPHMMFMALCTAYDLSDPRGFVPFIELLIELFKRVFLSL